MDELPMTRLILVLVASHCIADFFLQPDALVERKRKKRFLLLHGAIHAAVSTLAVQAWAFWPLPVYLFVVHSLIDGLKQHFADPPRAFLVDQAMHLVSLIALGWLMIRVFDQSPAPALFSEQIVVVLGGFVATVQGAAIVIGKFMEDLRPKTGLASNGLEDGGKWIGQLERALIFLLIFLGQPTGIGFLIAAKSILRFEEAKKQTLSEYILIGTLLSFLLAIALASATRWALRQFQG